MNNDTGQQTAATKPLPTPSPSGGIKISRVSPVLDFPYPEVPHRRSSCEKSQQPPEKDAHGTTAPLDSTPASITQAVAGGGTTDDGATRKPSQPLAGTQREVTKLLRGAGSAPSEPIVQKKLGKERPALRWTGTMLGRMKRTDTQTSAIYDPEVWPSDSETSDEEDPESAPDTHQEASVDAARLQRQVSATRAAQGRNQDYVNRFAVGNDDYQTRGHVSKNDGRLSICLRETHNRGYLAKTLGATIKHRIGQARVHTCGVERPALSSLHKDRRPPCKGCGTAASTIEDLDAHDPLPWPKMNIVIQVIGSRGDIQPFLRLGKILQEEHGHRVRIATHPIFKEFVEKDVGLEFFSVGGDPAELMAFMVKNPGLIPKKETFKSGEIQRRRASLFEMFKGFWRACINAGDDEHDPENLKRSTDKPPFVADAIIANPVSFAHIHCAERLGIPLHLMFTFPNTPTQQFPHPLTTIKHTNVDAKYTNYFSYQVVELLHWQGLGDLLNEFRVKTLGLDPVDTLWAPGQLSRMKLPYSYLWSPGLIPKPADWGPEINITGFVFLDLASSFKPPEDLTNFLEAGPPPVYVGFGSIVVDDPDRFTKLIFEAVNKAGVRALINKGWGGLGDKDYTPENIFMLDNTPHDWLFPRVSAVVHHGGAGTTAIGLKCGKPTLVVPFFGDQPFWGAMVAKAGAGAEPLPFKNLSAHNLAAGIQQLLTGECQKGANVMARRIAAEGDGAVNAVKSFHKSLPLLGPDSKMRCSILQDQVAVWQLKGMDVRLSALATEILVRSKKLTWNKLRLSRVYEYNFGGPGEPLTGVSVLMAHTMFDIAAGVGSVPYRMGRVIRNKKVRDKARRQSALRHTGSTSSKTPQVYGQHHHHDHADIPNKHPGTHQHHPDSRHHRHPGFHHRFRHINRKDHQEASPRNNQGESGEDEMERFLPHGDMLASKNQAEQVGPQSDSDSRRSVVPKRQDSQQDQWKPDSETAVGEDENQGDSDSDAERRDTESEADSHFERELAGEAGRGIARSGIAVAQIPLNLSLALAHGFHNAPRLYGDNTVRPVRRVNGYKSGFRAAGEEFVYELWDAWTGLVRHPFLGAQEDGIGGFFKGVGKGAGGFVLKPLAAVIGLPAYSVKGLTREATKGSQPTSFIRRARIVQGSNERGLLASDELRGKETAVQEAWETIEEIIRLIKKRQEGPGLKGRVGVWKDRKWLKENGVIRNVENGRRALDAKREGRDWEVEFRDERAQSQRLMEQRVRNMKAAKRGRRRKRTESVDSEEEALAEASQEENDKERTGSKDSIAPKDSKGGIIQKLKTRTLTKKSATLASAEDGTATMDKTTAAAASPQPPKRLLVVPDMQVQRPDDDKANDEAQMNGPAEEDGVKRPHGSMISEKMLETKDSRLTPKNGRAPDAQEERTVTM